MLLASALLLSAQQPAQPGAPVASAETRSTVIVQPAQVGSTNPFGGSVSSGQVTATEIPLTLDDALTRALRYNLALVEGDENVRLRRAERLRSLSNLLPTLNLRPSVSEQQVNLAAFGFSGFPGLPQVVGPFTVYDFRGYGAESLSFQNLRNLRAANENIRSAQLTVRDAREQVVLVVTAAYLTALAGAARIDSQRAQLETAETEYRQALDRRNAGTVPGIDVLRAQVQAQSEQQRLIAYEGDFDKQKLTIARAIGLPAGQQFRLADQVRSVTLPPEAPLESVLDLASKQRADIQAAQSAVRAAELSVAAAQAGRYPSVGIDANYGANGLSPTALHGSFTVAAGVNIPVFQGGRVRADVEAAETTLRQRRASLDDLRGQVDAEVRNAFTDLRSASRQLEVATKNLDLSRQELQQARDRFAAGVTNNLEVVQAQDAVAAANENFISSLYYFYGARLSISRARGDAEQSVRNLLRNQK